MMGMFGVDGIFSEWIDRISGDRDTLTIDLHGLTLDFGGQTLRTCGRIRVGPIDFAEE